MSQDVPSDRIRHGGVEGNLAKVTNGKVGKPTEHSIKRRERVANHGQPQLIASGPLGMSCQNFDRL